MREPALGNEEVLKPMYGDRCHSVKLLKITHMHTHTHTYLELPGF